MKPTTAELEQEALLKNFLDGLEPLEAEKTRTALRGVSSLPTVEEEYLESFPAPSTDAFDVDRPEWKLAEELNLGLEEATRVLEWHQVALIREIEWAKSPLEDLSKSFDPSNRHRIRMHRQHLGCACRQVRPDQRLRSRLHRFHQCGAKWVVQAGSTVRAQGDRATGIPLHEPVYSQ